MRKAEKGNLYNSRFGLPLKLVLVTWAILIMCYFYFSRGYWELFRQLGALIFG
jgi:hypothetical protein